jgi:hypothetical protein
MTCLNISFENILWFMLNNARMGLTNIMPTIIIGNMEMELPTMYIMNKFIGTYFRNRQIYIL